MLKDNNQGDQIDICTCWPIVLFGQFFKRVCATFLNCKSYVLILTKIGWESSTYSGRVARKYILILHTYVKIPIWADIDGPWNEIC
jgi:hypothetical protein